MSSSCMIMPIPRSSSGGGGSSSFVVKTANYTAVSGDRILADMTGGAFTITLPPTPSDGDWVEIAPAQVNPTFSGGNLTIDRNGESINGAAANWGFQSRSGGGLFIFADTYGWRCIPYPNGLNWDGGADGGALFRGKPGLTATLSIDDVTLTGGGYLTGMQRIFIGLTRITGDAESMRLDNNGTGNPFGIGNLSFGEFAQQASLGTVAANCARIGAMDVSGTAEIFVKDEAGNETQISPHNHTAPNTFIDSPFDEIGYSANYFVGLVVYTNKQRQRAGRLDFQFVETFAQHNTRTGKNLTQLDWVTVEQAKVAESQIKHDAWQSAKTKWEADPVNNNIPFPEPEPSVYVAKPVPSWLTNQLANRTAYVAANNAVHTSTAGLVVKRTALKNAIATLRTWATDATNAANNWGTRTQVQKDAIHVTTFNRLSTLMDRFADLLETQGIGD